MNDEKRCEKCGVIYRSTQEITERGGRVWHFGLNLRGHCVCGGTLGSVGSLWNKTDVVTPVGGMSGNVRKK